MRVEKWSSGALRAARSCIRLKRPSSREQSFHATCMFAFFVQLGAFVPRPDPVFSSTPRYGFDRALLPPVTLWYSDVAHQEKQKRSGTPRIDKLSRAPDRIVDARHDAIRQFGGFPSPFLPRMNTRPSNVPPGGSSPSALTDKGSRALKRLPVSCHFNYDIAFDL
jgi:hypothetical protein